MASPDLFKKPNVQVFQATSRIQRQKPSKSCSSMLSKSLVIILVLVVIPLFPSQAPDFINQSIFTKFWELFHLLFIGIAVSYGLFSRRSVKMEMEIHSGPDTSHPYLSGISKVSSFFEDGLENVCISDEKKMMHNLDPQYLYNESFSKGSYACDEGEKLRSLNLRNDFENISEADGENVSHIWSSQYFQGESLVVVTDGNCTPEEHKPLGLPIRSLRSRNRGAEKPQFANRSGSNSSLKSSVNNDGEGGVEKIRGMTPTNLHNEFEEVVGASAIPWKSRSGRIEMREEVGNTEPPGHYRPHSVGEFEFKQLESRSFRQPVSSSNSSKSLGTRTSSVSPELSNIKMENLRQRKDLKVGCEPISHRPHSVGEFEFKQVESSSFWQPVSSSNSSKSWETRTSSVSPELSNIKMGNLGQKKDLKVGCEPISHSKVANRNNGLSFTSIEAGSFSTGPSSELDMQKSSEDDFKDFNRSAKQHLLGRGKPSSDPVSPDAKPSNLSKILSRAKSVRTFRSGRYVIDKMKRKEKYSNQTADKVEEVDDQIAAPVLVDTQTTEHEDPSVDIQKQNSDKDHPVMSSIFPEYQNQEKQHPVDSDLVSEEDSESQSDSNNDQDSSDEDENVSGEVDDEDLAGSEVDRKADEFIAKFREQIRLQKISSVRKHSGC